MKPTYEELVSQLERSRRLCDEALKSEIAWEMAMMKACGEDGPASVSAKFMELQSQNADMAVQLANAESKCRELAAENAGLKDGVNKAVEDIQCFYDSDGWHVSEDGESETAVVALDDAKGSIEHFALSVKTPAADAFLAEMRAQGVEMYADTLDRGADDAERDGFEYGMKFLRAEAEGVRKFAAQLRQEAAQ